MSRYSVSDVTYPMLMNHSYHYKLLTPPIFQKQLQQNNQSYNAKKTKKISAQKVFTSLSTATKESRDKKRCRFERHATNINLTCDWSEKRKWLYISQGAERRRKLAKSHPFRIKACSLYTRTHAPASKRARL